MNAEQVLASDPPADGVRIPSVNFVYHVDEGRAIWKAGKDQVNGWNWVRDVEIPVLGMLNRDKDRRQSMFAPRVLSVLEGQAIVTEREMERARLPAVLFNAGSLEIPEELFHHLGKVVASIQNRGQAIIESERPPFIYNKRSGIFVTAAGLTTMDLPPDIAAVRDARPALQGNADSMQAEFLANRSFVHGDPSWDNILIDAADHKQVTLVDWEFSCLADPAWDVGRFLASSHCFEALMDTNPDIAYDSELLHARLERARKAFGRGYQSKLHRDDAKDIVQRARRQLPYHLLRLGQGMPIGAPSRSWILQRLLELT